jgi:hypothetical protein
VTRSRAALLAIVALARTALPTAAAARIHETAAAAHAPLRALPAGALDLVAAKDAAYTVPPSAEYESVGLDGALTGAGRTSLPDESDPACKARFTNLPTVPVRTAFCWDTLAQGDREDFDAMPWVPQGLATSGESQLDGTPTDGSGAVLPRSLIANRTWLHPDSDYRYNSVRLAFVNLEDREYRNVLPVWVDGSGVLRRVYGHGGGLAWFGPYLFMTSSGGWRAPGPDSTRNTIRVFDTRKIYRHRDDGGGDYRYVMPEVRRYITPIRFDYISLDRNSAWGPTLVAGTYVSSADGTLSGTKVARYDFRSGSAGDYRLATGMLQGWESTVPAARENAISDVQGMQADGDELYFNMSKGSLTQRRFAAVDVAGPRSDWTIQSHTRWAFRPQDLSLWYENMELWGMTEGEEDRVVFSVAQSDLIP